MSSSYSAESDRVTDATTSNAVADSATVHRAETPNKESRANIFSRLLFIYADSMMKLGASRPLEHEDLFKLSDAETSEYCAASFDELWAEELASEKPSLSRTLRRMMGYKGVLAVVLATIGGLLPFSGPFLLQQLILWLDDKKGTLQTGIIIAVLMMVLPFIGNLTTNAVFRLFTFFGVQWRAALDSAIFRKSLRLTNESRQTADHGKIVQYMSTDAEFVFGMTYQLVTVFGVPTQIILALTFLAILLKWAVFGGVIVALLFVPINVIIALSSNKYNKLKLSLGDERVKMMQELLAGMKVIKFNTYEDNFLRRILNKRDEELKCVSALAKNEAAIFASIIVSPTLIFLGAIVMYALLYGFPTTETVFVSYSLFNLLRMPLTEAPQIIIAFLLAKASIGRIESFLLLEEIPDDFGSAGPVKKGKPVASIKGGTFKWAPPPVKEDEEEAGAEGGGGDGTDTAGAASDSGDASESSASACGGASDSGDRKKSKKGSKGSKANGRANGKANGKAKAAKGSGKKGKKSAADRSAERSASDDNNKDGKDGKGEPTVSNREYALRNIDMSVGEGELVMIVGPVGSGKSSLLSALLGEIKAVKGKATIRGRVAYVPQSAWIVNKTLRDNVTLGQEFDAAKYEETIKACALEADIAVLPGGDLTEIGERGINLSGGQKQRVSLARAVYADADTYVIDDPLSAVDAHVGKHLFKEVINGKLRKKTRILTTNQLQYLPSADNVIVLAEDGTIAEAGTFTELMANDGDFAEMFRSHMGEDDDESEDASSVDGERGGRGGPAAGEDKAAEDEAGKDLMTVEDRNTGHVKLSSYTSYISSLGGVCFFAVWLLLFILPQAADNYGSVFLTYWLEDAFNKPLEWYVGAIALFAGINTLGVLARELFYISGRVRASRLIHESALRAVVSSPMAFFDTTPQGRIINRFSKDVTKLDTQLPTMLSFLLLIVTILLGFVATTVYVTPWYLIAVVVMSPFYYFFQNYYRRTGIELERLDSIARSPVFSHFGETLYGVESIRAYGLQDAAIDGIHDRVDASHEAFTATLLANFWLSVRLAFVGSVLTGSTAFAIVLTRGAINTGLAALAISYSMSTQLFLEFLVQIATQLENQMNSVERLEEFAGLEPEAAYVVDDNRPPTEWPTKGEIRLDKVSMRYRPGLPLVLKGVSFKVRGGEKVGVVGRTGSGKSSLMLLLFRLVEAAEGTISIDGIDIGGIGLHDLRRKLAIIPQDPVLFNGTFRENLDPFSEYSDKEIKKVVEMALLKNVVDGLDGGIDGMIAEGGSNLSVGQRQLVCLGRALLRKPKVLILDEATASVDFDTDVAIQRTVRTAFKHATTLTIAHRLNTIVDSNRVLVLDDGRVAEYDTPANLLSNEDGIFFHLVNETGSASAKHLMDVAEGRASYLDILSMTSFAETPGASAGNSFPAILAADGSGSGSGAATYSDTGGDESSSYVLSSS